LEFNLLIGISDKLKPQSMKWFNRHHDIAKSVNIF